MTPAIVDVDNLLITGFAKADCLKAAVLVPNLPRAASLPTLPIPFAIAIPGIAKPIPESNTPAIDSQTNSLSIEKGLSPSL